MRTELNISIMGEKVEVLPGDSQGHFLDQNNCQTSTFTRKSVLILGTFVCVFFHGLCGFLQLFTCLNIIHTSGANDHVTLLN